MNENLSRILGGILLIGIGTGLLFQYQAVILADPYSAGEGPFILGFFGGTMIAGRGLF